MRIVFAGTPEFALPALEAIACSRHELVGVLTRPDRPRGRGRLIGPSPVKQVALARGLPIAQPPTLATPEDRAPLRAWRPDVLVVVAYGLILPTAVLGLPRLGCLNIHASLLPRWRGAAPIQRAILAGDAQTGVAIMQMDAGLDTGPVLIERRVPIERTTTGGALHDQLAALGAEALLDALREIEAGSARPRPQPAEGATYAAKITKAEARIDWNESALAIERRVRAFNPWPIAETRFDGEPLRILAARAEALRTSGDLVAPPAEAVSGEPAASAVPPGTILATERGALLVRCGEGSLAITELQRPGRRALSTDAFLNAVPVAPGKQLG